MNNKKNKEVIIQILKKTIVYLKSNSPEVAQKIDQDISNPKLNFEKLNKKYQLYFAPTGLFQDLSIEYNWSKEYEILATLMDTIAKD